MAHLPSEWGDRANRARSILRAQSVAPYAIDDALQHAALSALQKIDALDKRTLLAWILRVARNHLVDEHRRSTKTRESLPDEPSWSPVEPTAESRDELNALVAACEILTPGEKAALLAFLNDETLPPSQARQLSRARLHLRRITSRGMA